MDAAAVAAVIESVLGRTSAITSAPLYEQFDSIEILELFAALEAVFGIKIDEASVVPGDLATLDQLVALLNRLHATQEALRETS
jgi:acyl carrier protein